METNLRSITGYVFPEAFGENAPTWGYPDFEPGWNHVYGEPLAFKRRVEFIQSKRGRKRFNQPINPVFHWKCWSQPIPVIGCNDRFGGNFTIPPGTVDRTPPWRCQSVVHTPYNISIPLILPMPEFQPDIDSLVDGAIRDSIPSWNVLVSAAEAFDIPSTFEGVLRQGLAGETLRYNLAVSPLVGEVQAIATRMGHWQQLIADVNESLSRGFRAVTGAEFNDLRHINYRIINGLEFRYTYMYNVSYTYGCVVIGNIPPVTARLERLGINSSLADTVWNLLPLSFVVDYFISIGDILVRPILPNFVVQKSWKSTKVEGSFLIELKQGGLWHKCQQGEYESYNRERLQFDIPDGILSDSRVVGLPRSSTQWANLASLARLFSSR